MANDAKVLRCAIYTRKSTEHGLEQEFNSLDAQREACEAYIKSQAFQGWRPLPQQYNDPAFSGGNLDRPALKRLLADVEAGQIGLVRGRDPAVQHDHVHGPADTEHSPVLCPVRARAVS